MTRAIVLVITVWCATACLRRTTPSLPDYASGEHVMIGESAFDAACRRANETCTHDLRIARQDQRDAFTYGELVAFAGDFYASPEAMWSDSKVFNANTRSSKAFFRREVAAISHLERSVKVDYPSYDAAYLASFPNYLSLAMDNDIHFGFNNMVGYVKHHAEALNFARDAYRRTKTDSAGAQVSWRRALFHNAFADHLLSDAFAAGHIRVPRTQIRAWVIERGGSKALAGTFSKILHDRDGKLSSSQPQGLHVGNARGDRWATRVDTELYWNDGVSRAAAERVVEAVSLSVRELFVAYRTGILPDGLYAATLLTPFPDAERERPFADRFGSLEQEYVQSIMNESQWYSRIPVFGGFTEQKLKEFLGALPAIMQMFRDDVRASIAATPALRERLPPAYLDAFENLR